MKEKNNLFESILTNFQFSVISRTTSAFWYFDNAVISYACTCISGKSVPLGITAGVTKYNFGVDQNYWDSPIYNMFFLCYSFLFPQ